MMSTNLWPDSTVLLPPEVLLERARQRIPGLEERVRALPSEVDVGDMFTGTGCFHKAVSALFDTLKWRYPMASSHIDVTSSDFG